VTTVTATPLESSAKTKQILGSDGDVGSVFTRDQLLANISFYWFTAAVGSSFYPYYITCGGIGRG